MSVPAWADADLSASIPAIREAGEGQTAEFKVEIPKQASDIGKEVAAFATCGGGVILLGVNNNGSVAGLSAETEDERDALIHRLQGIIRNVKPQVLYELGIASDEGKLVAVITVKVQEEPVFYHEGRPYIRDGRTSRPAEPDEVKKHVWKHPSSEHQRELEKLDLESQRVIVESSKQMVQGRRNF